MYKQQGGNPGRCRKRWCWKQCRVLSEIARRYRIWVYWIPALLFIHKSGRADRLDVALTRIAREMSYPRRSSSTSSLGEGWGLTQGRKGARTRRARFGLVAALRLCVYF